MRVLVVPEYYREQDPTASGTVNDARAWLREWLELDETIHVYLLAPPSDAGRYRPETLFGDHERVTLLSAEPPLSTLQRREPFTETGYSAQQLRAIRREIHGRDAYVDVVIDQLRDGRTVLSKWLLDASDQWAAEVRPFDVVANVHDLQVPRKYRYCSYRDRFQFQMEAASAAFADGVWFTAGVDRDSFREAVGFLSEEVVQRAVGDALVAGSPIEFDRFEQAYADEPEWLHLAGSFWAKKNVDEAFAVAETLHDEFGIETVLTSPEGVPASLRRPEWVEAHGQASRETYERALERGDITVHASDYETMARTPFEQAAAGQVLVLRDRPWASECVPDDYPLMVPLSELEGTAVAAVEDWERAVAAARRLVNHARDVRGREMCGRRTYRDLRERVDRKTMVYGRGKRPEVVAAAVDDCGDRFELPTLTARTATYTDSGRPLPAEEDYAPIDVVYTLRALGFVDTGAPGTPVFRRR